MNESQSTRILIERIQEGDGKAKDELYQRLQLPVLFLVRVNLGRRLRSKVESWDIVQEALMRSLNDLANFRYERDDAFRRYLRRKVEHVIRDQADFWSAQKRDARREVSMQRQNKRGSSDVIELPEPRPAATPSEKLVLDENLSRLAEAMDQLAEEAPETWEIVVSVKVVGSSLREVAAERETTSDAIKMKLRRGMSKLASIYRKIESRGTV